MILEQRKNVEANCTDNGHLRRDRCRALCGELAAVARTIVERSQQREESARSLVEERQHYVVAAVAGMVRFDADRVGRSHLPERGGEQRFVSVVRGPRARRPRLEATRWRRQCPHNETEHVDAFTGYRR